MAKHQWTHFKSFLREKKEGKRPQSLWTRSSSPLKNTSDSQSESLCPGPNSIASIMPHLDSVTQVPEGNACIRCSLKAPLLKGWMRRCAGSKTFWCNISVENHPTKTHTHTHFTGCFGTGIHPQFLVLDFHPATNDADYMIRNEMARKNPRDTCWYIWFCAAQTSCFRLDLCHLLYHWIFRLVVLKANQIKSNHYEINCNTNWRMSPSTPNLTHQKDIQIQSCRGSPGKKNSDSKSVTSNSLGSVGASIFEN